MDYRIKQNRREAFIRWYAWSLEYKDCDPAVWLTNYLHERYEHNDEQKLWLAWLYGNTYNLPTAWLLFNEFPDFELATVDRIEKWNTNNYSRLRYQTDTKWNKGHLPKMFESYKTFIGSNNQRDVIESYYEDDKESNFNCLWNIIKSNLYKFGRYSTWFYLQHLKHTAAVAITPTSLMFNDYSGSRSHRNGFLYVIGKDDDIDKKLTSKEYNNLEAQAKDITVEMKSRFKHLAEQVDFFTMETCLCSYKKIFRESHSRYLGYYLDRQAEEIINAENDGWYGIDWDVLWQARKETIDPRLNIKSGVDKTKYKQFYNTGNIQNLNWMFSDEKTNLIGLEAIQ